MPTPLSFHNGGVDSKRLVVAEALHWDDDWEPHTMQRVFVVIFLFIDASAKAYACKELNVPTIVSEPGYYCLTTDVMAGPDAGAYGITSYQSCNDRPSRFCD